MRDLGHFPELLSCLFLISYERLFVDKMWIKQHPEKLFRFFSRCFGRNIHQAQNHARIGG